MKPSFILELALKDIKGYKLRSILTIGGVVIGISFIIFLLSLGFGLERLITSQVTDIKALRVLDVSSSKILKIDDDTIENFGTLGTLDEIIPSVNISGKIEYDTSTTDGVIYGKDPSYISLEGTKLLYGKSYTDKSKKETIVNITALKQLGEKNYSDAIGKKLNLTLIIPTELVETEENKSIQEVEEYVITGVIDNESSPFAYVPLESMKTMGVVKYNNAKTKVKDKDKVDLAKKQIENLGYKVVAIKDTLEQITQFFTIFKFILVGFGLIAMVVASLGMFNTLTISLLEKTREIGLLKALGTTNKDIHRIFLTQALSIGFLGGILGIIVGVSSGGIINLIIYRLAIRTGNEPVSLFYTPLSIIVILFTFSILVSLITGLYPSRRAAKISALNALRYE